MQVNTHLIRNSNYVWASRFVNVVIYKLDPPQVSGGEPNSNRKDLQVEPRGKDMEFIFGVSNSF